MAKQLTDLPVQMSAADNGLMLFQDPARSAGDRSTQIQFSVLAAALLKSSNNLSDLASATTARTNLGLGTAATATLGAANGVAPLDSSSKIPQSILPSTYTTTIGVTPQAIAYNASVTLDLSQRNNFVVGTLTGNITLTFSNPVAGASGYIVLTQDATGSRTLTLGGSNTKKPGGTAPVLSTAANSVDKLYWDSHDGSNVNLILQKDFK
jgi:hypothetical protein